MCCARDQTLLHVIEIAHVAMDGERVKHIFNCGCYVDDVSYVF